MRARHRRPHPKSAGRRSGLDVHVELANASRRAEIALAGQALLQSVELLAQFDGKPVAEGRIVGVDQIGLDAPHVGIDSEEVCKLATAEAKATGVDRAGSRDFPDCSVNRLRTAGAPLEDPRQYAAVVAI